MSSDEELVAIKERAVEQLFRLPGVTAVGIGGRVRDGRPTGETVLKVFVSRKKTLTDLEPGAVVPAEFEGVPTDVDVLGDLEPDADPPPGRVEPPVEMLDDTRQRALIGGCQMQVDLVGSGIGSRRACSAAPRPGPAAAAGAVGATSARTSDRITNTLRYTGLPLIHRGQDR